MLCNQYIGGMKMKLSKLAKVGAVMLSSMLAFTACGGASTSEPVATTEASTTESAEAPAAEDTAKEDTASGDKLRVAMVTDIGGVNDQSFNQSSWEGLQRAADELGVEVNYIESSTEADYEPNIETLVDQDYDLICAIGFMMSDAVAQAAELYPDQKFAIIDDDANKDLENVSCLMFKQNEASYLVGVVAAKTSQTNKAGFVLGMATPVMNQFGYGYLAGILDTNPDMTIEQQNINSFADAAAGKAATIQMYADGVDVVFQAAGDTGNGVIEAAKEQNKWVIGVDKDQSFVAPENVLTSAMKRVDNAIYDIVKQCQEGTLKGGVYTYGMDNGGVDIAPTTTNLSEDVLAYVNDIKAKILSGEIVVPETQADFEAKYGDVYTLD